MTAKTCPVEVTADDLVHEFPTVFDGQVKTMKGERFTILFKKEAKPFCVTAPRTIPCAYRDKVQQELHTLESQSIYNRLQSWMSRDVSRSGDTFLSVSVSLCQCLVSVLESLGK